MSSDYESLTSAPAPAHAVDSPSTAGWRDQARRDVAGLSYAEGAARLSPDPDPVVQKKDDPQVSETATTTLDGIVDSDHAGVDLCYMENAGKVQLILEAHKAALVANDAERGKDDKKNADEVALVTKMVAFLEYASKYVEYVNLRGTKKKEARKKLDELAATAFPDLAAGGADPASKALYYIMSTQPSQIRKSPTPMRGGGVGAAMAMMGGAEMIYQDEMKAGGLKPGAPLQMWWGGDYRLTHQAEGETTTLSAKQVYSNITKARIHSSESISGHSVTFVKYDEADKNKIWYLQQWNNKLDSATLGESYQYFVGANLSTTGEATNAAEYVLRETGFRADAGKDTIVSVGRRYKLDPAKLAAALIASINGSGHADLANIQKSVTHTGTPSAFDHDMARLIGLWQYAMGDLAVDGAFGNASCTRLTGNNLSKADSLKVSSGDGS